MNQRPIRDESFMWGREGEIGYIFFGGGGEVGNLFSYLLRGWKYIILGGKGEGVIYF